MVSEKLLECFWELFFSQKLIPSFNKLALDKEEVKQDLLNASNGDKLLYFLKKINVIDVRACVAEFDIRQITAADYSGDRCGYAVGIYNTEGKTLDEYEETYFDFALSQFTSKAEMEKGFEEIKKSFESRFSHFEKDKWATFQKNTWNPKEIRISLPDGNHRFFKLRYLCKQLDISYKIKGQFEISYLDESKIEKLKEEDWFIIPSGMAEELSHVEKHLKKTAFFLPVNVFPSTFILSCPALRTIWREYSYICFNPNWKLSNMARKAGLFDLNAFIEELLQAQKSNLSADW